MPDDKWAQYQSSGDKWAQYASAASAEPSTYSKLTASYNPDVEEFAQKHPVLGPVVRFLDAAGGAAMATPESIYQALRHPVDTAKGAMESVAAWKDPNVRAGALSVLPEALGAGVGSVAGGEATVPVAKGAGKVAGKALIPAKPALMAGAEMIQHPLKMAELPGRGLKAVISKIPDKPAPPEFPGASLPSTEEFYAARGSELETMRKINEKVVAAQEKALAKAAPKARKGGYTLPPDLGTSTATIGPGAAVPKGSPTPFQPISQGTMTKTAPYTEVPGITPPPTPTPAPSTIVSPETATLPQGKQPTSLLSRGRTLVEPGLEPDLNNPVHVKMINDYQTMGGPALRQLASAGDRFAAFVLRHMPRP